MLEKKTQLTDHLVSIFHELLGHCSCWTERGGRKPESTIAQMNWLKRVPIFQIVDYRDIWISHRGELLSVVFEFSVFANMQLKACNVMCKQSKRLSRYALRWTYSISKISLLKSFKSYWMCNSPTTSLRQKVLLRQTSVSAPKKKRNWKETSESHKMIDRVAPPLIKIQISDNMAT